MGTKGVFCLVSVIWFANLLHKICIGFLSDKWKNMTYFLESEASSVMAKLWYVIPLWYNWFVCGFLCEVARKRMGKSLGEWNCAIQNIVQLATQFFFIQEGACSYELVLLLTFCYLLSPF